MNISSFGGQGGEKLKLEGVLAGTFRMEKVRRACFKRKGCQALEIQGDSASFQVEIYLSQVWKRLGRSKHMKGTVNADGRMRNRIEKNSGKTEIELCWRQG